MGVVYGRRRCLSAARIWHLPVVVVALLTPLVNGRKRGAWWKPHAGVVVTVLSAQKMEVAEHLFLFLLSPCVLLCV